MTLGVTVGKFHPFHLGHDHLLRTAKAQVDHLVVLVGDAPGQTPPAEVRAGWIRALHPDVEVRVVPEDIPETPAAWGARALEVLGGRRPDLAFTSEAYGEPWAAAMGARHVAVDPDRSAVAISGTALRADLGARWRLLTAPARAHFARRVVVLGVESSGTTTLARDLAERLGTAWVPEVGRAYWEGRRWAPDAERWTSDDLLAIARGQAALEDALAARADRVLVCDTDPLATTVWHRRYVGGACEALERLAAGRRCDLYLLTVPDFPFVQDGTRESEALREAMHGWFEEALARRGVPWVALGGPHEVRMARALEAIAPLRRFSPIP